MSKKVATFVRVGNTENAETSLKCQEMSVQEYCEKNGYDVVDSAQVVGDRKLGQNMLLQMLDRAGERGFDTVVMYSSNPIARSMVEMQENQQAMDKVGVSLETVDGSHLCISTLENIAAAAEAAGFLEFDSTDSELVFGYDLTEDGLEVNEDEAEVVKYIFDKTQEYAEKPPADLIQDVIDEYSAMGEEISATDAAKKVSYSAVVLRVEQEVKDMWPEQYEAMIRKQNHNRELAARRASYTPSTAAQSHTASPLIDRGIWDTVQQKIK